MNTKEAIEFLEIEYSNINPDYPLSAKTWEEKKKRYDEIIKLLKRGEKYEKMWEELENEGKNYSYSYIATTKWLMDNIKQKYFPKGK